MINYIVLLCRELKSDQQNGCIRKVVVIPKRFENAVLIGLHSQYGHIVDQKLFETARLLFYMKGLYQSCHLVEDTCPTCQECKINVIQQTPELNKVPRFAQARCFI